MILIGLGANLPSVSGAPAATLRAALKALATDRTQLEAVSPFYSSPAWPNPADPRFVNAVAQLTTSLSPRELLDFLHATETAFGRNRSVKNAPRTLDLDLLDFDGLVERGTLELPHPRLAERAFVLVPLRDIAPAWRHPVSGRSVDQLLAELGEEAHIPLRIPENPVRE